MDRVCANGLGENTRDKLVGATRAGHRDTVVVLPVEIAPGIATAEKELKLLIRRAGLRMGEVYEAVERQLDLVA